MGRIGEVYTKDGKLIGLYQVAGSKYHFSLKCNGENVQDFEFIGDANRAYNKLVNEMNELAG
jgi:hypothetical protein